MRVWIDQDLCTGDGLCVDLVETGRSAPPARRRWGEQG